MATPQAPLPGWYPDPSGGPGLRYWDGREWTIVAPAGTPPPPSPDTGSNSALTSPTSGTGGSEGGVNTNAQRPNIDRRAGVAVLVIVAVVAVGIGLAAAFGRETEPPADEDAYIAELFTSKFDSLLPKRPFIEEGYAACDLLRKGHTEEEASNIMWQRDTSGGTDPEMVRDRHQRQTVAAHRHLCPGA